MAQRERRRPALTEAHARLGSELSRIRNEANVTTRGMGDYTSGHISNVEAGYVTPSKELVAKYAELGGDFGRLLLMLEDAKNEASQKRRRSREEDSPSIHLLDPNADMLTLRQGFRFESYENSVQYGANRVPQSSVLTARIRPTAEQARYFVYRCAYEDDPRRGVMTVDAVAGCKLVRIEDSDKGVLDIVADFREDSVLTEDGAYELTLYTRIHSEVSLSPRLLLGFLSPLPRCVVSVRFHESIEPIKVWWMRESVPYVNEPKPHQFFDRNPAHYYGREFLDLKNEYCGLAWDWGDN